MKRKNNSSAEECLEASFSQEDEVEFLEGEPDCNNSLATFNFAMTNDQKGSNTSRAADKFVSTSTPKGITPPIDGEHFTVKRGYQLRPSTLRKLNELKAKHPDVNAYLNTILDAAIQHYYNYIINENGNFLP